MKQLLLYSFFSLFFFAPNIPVSIIGGEEIAVGSDLVVEVDRDCSDAEQTETYTLIVSIQGGVPPYTISGSIEAILEDNGEISTIIEDGFPYEVNIVDAEENEFHETGGPCTLPLCKAFQIASIQHIATCLCNDRLVINSTFDGLVESERIIHIHGYIHNETNSVEIEIGDTILSNSSIEIYQIFTDYTCYSIYYEGDGVIGYASDFCTSETYTLQANDDFASTKTNETITIYPLQNDIGTSIEITRILVTPNCGTIMSINPDTGEIVYTPDVETTCAFDTFVYEVVDDCGNLTTASITIIVEKSNELTIEFDNDCANAIESGYSSLYVAVTGGVPPYSISIGDFNEVLEEEGIVGAVIEACSFFEIIVTDAEDSKVIESDYATCHHLCSKFGFDTDFIVEEGYLECLCDGSLLASFAPIAEADNGIQSIDGFYYMDNEAIPIEVGGTIPPHAYFEIFKIETDFTTYIVHTQEDDFLGGFTSNFCPTPCIEANTDLTTTSPTESVTFNVLENDIGEEIFIKEITEQPLCGTVEVINSELGEVRYTPDMSCLLGVVNFEYEIEDEEGNSASAIVKIVLNRSGNDLVVLLETDCTNADETGTYVLNLTVVEGVPPFIVSGSTNNLLEDFGAVSVIIEEGVSFEVSVIDAVGNKFHQTGSDAACMTLGPQERLHHIDQIGNCLCDGSLLIDFEGLNIDLETVTEISGYWIDENENELPIELGSIIPADNFFFISHILTGNSGAILLTQDILKYPQGFPSNFCPTPCIEANTDLATTSPTESITFNVLENDIGEGIFIKEITEQPLCGTLEVIDSELGEVRYTPEPNCFMEILHFTYQIEDIESNIATARVNIVIDPYKKDLVVDVKKDCSISDETGTYLLEVTIAKGVPPFNISETIDTVLEETGTISIEREDGLMYGVYVEDAAENEFFEAGGEIPCTAPFLIVHKMSDIAECTCEGGLIFHFEGIELNEPIVSIDGRWVGEFGNSGDIGLGDTIPHNASFSLYYLETENTFYTLMRGCSFYFIEDYIPNFCQPSPIPTLNESESQTLICGEGAIILTAENAGEGAVYSWYYEYDPFFSWEVPADPPTGQTWINSEIVGPRIIYLVVTDANGCQSEPLAISTYSFEEIKAEDLEVVIEAQNCDRYRVSFLIIGGNGAYKVNGQPTFEQFTSDWIPTEEDYSFTIDDSDLIPNCEPITVSGSAMDLECLPVAKDDFRTNIKGENTLIQALTNDTGKNIQLSSIVSLPSCGNIVDIDVSTGTITYQGDIETTCEGDTFEYEIIDTDGNTDIGAVSILFVNNSSELVVNVSSDCNDQYIGGTYDLTIQVLGGVPPFEISGIIGSSPDLIFDTFNYTLEDFGEVTGTFEPIGYELEVIDAMGNKFEKNDLLPCCKDIEIITQLDCFVENEDTLAVLTYEIINAEDDFIIAPPQNDTLQQGQVFEILVINSIECGAELLDTVACDFTPISNIKHRAPNIQIYPNPSNGNFTLSLQLEQTETIDIQIIDILGQEKLWQRLQTLPTVERQDFDLNLNLPSGLYFLQVSGKNWRWMEKVILR